jgi:drug/metabolite transporter (DMT)-like permease
MTPGQGAALRGIGWMALAGLLNTMTGLLVRQLSDDFSAMELAFFRNVVALAVLLPWLLHKGVGSMRIGRLPLYALRTVLTYLGMVMMFYGLAHIPIAEVFALQFTIPLLTIILAVVFLGQTAGLRSWIGCLVGFAGALVIIRPGFIELSPATMMVLGSVVLYSGSNTILKLLTETHSPVVITIYSNLFMLPLSLIPALFVWATPSLEHMPLIIGLGLASGLGGLCFTLSVAAADARVVQPFQFLRMPIAATLGFLVFGDVAGVWVWAGAVIIFASATYVGRLETGRKPGGGLS